MLLLVGWLVGWLVGLVWFGLVSLFAWFGWVGLFRVGLVGLVCSFSYLLAWVGFGLVGLGLVAWFVGVLVSWFVGVAVGWLVGWLVWSGLVWFVCLLGLVWLGWLCWVGWLVCLLVGCCCCSSFSLAPAPRGEMAMVLSTVWGQNGAPAWEKTTCFKEKGALARVWLVFCTLTRSIALWRAQVKPLQNILCL